MSVCCVNSAIARNDGVANFVRWSIVGAQRAVPLSLIEPDVDGGLELGTARCAPTPSVLIHKNKRKILVDDKNCCHSW